MSMSNDVRVAFPPLLSINKRCVTSAAFTLATVSGVADFRDEVSIPKPVLDGVWKKASNLLASTNAIAKSPGSDQKVYSIFSMTSVVHTGTHMFSYLAVAELNHDLPQVVSWLIKVKRQPLLTKLVVTIMPDGRGKKEGRSTGAVIENWRGGCSNPSSCVHCWRAEKFGHAPLLNAPPQN